MQLHPRFWRQEEGLQNMQFVMQAGGAFKSDAKRVVA